MAFDDDEDIPTNNESSVPSRDSDPSPSPPSTRKRPRTAACAWSANISLPTKNRVITSSDSLCWLCGLNGRHIAHVIRRSDQVMFNDLRASNLLTFPSLDSFPNLIYLCPGCHSSYIERVPAWTFLPSDLDAFLAAEQAYHDLRASSYPTPVPRPAPPHAALYTRYQIRTGSVFTWVFREHPTKTWGGSPVAAIIRSAGVLCDVKRLGAQLCGMPDGVAAKLQRLLWMYGMADPEPPRAMQSVPDDDEDKDRDEIGIEKASQRRPPLPTAAGPTCPPARPPREGKQKLTQQHGHTTHKHLPRQPMKSAKRRRKAGGTESDWMYGPKSTANDIALWFTFAGGHTP